MAPIQFLFTSALVLSAAVAAPINANHGKVDTTTPSKHQSEPIRMADPVKSSVPVMSMDTQAMKSSAVAMAVQTPSSSDNGQQSDGVLGVFNKLPLKRGEENRRQFEEVTDLLTSINSIAKRDELEERQLGLVKSVPETVGQAAQVEKLVEGLPIKRDGILGGLGGLGGVLGGSVKRETGEAKTHDKAYTEKALKGFQGWLHHGSKDHKEKTPEIPSAADSIGLGDVVKRGDAADPVTGLLNGLLARDAEESKSHDATHTEKALKGFQGWLHHDSKDHKEGTPEIPSTADSIGLNDVIKRSSPADPVTDLLSLLAKRESMESDENAVDGLAKRRSPLDTVTGLINGLAKREHMETDENIVDGLAKRGGPLDTVAGLINGLAKREMVDSLATSEDVADALDGLAKRNGLDSVDQLIKGLTKGGQLNNGLNIRQLNVLSTLATGALSNAGSAAGQLGKVAAGKFRRGNVDAGSMADAATAGMNVGNHKAGKDNGENSSDVNDVAEEVAEGEHALHDATASPEGRLDRRQVPPIAGSDALSIVKGLVANPNAALDPVTKGILVGGTALGNLAPQ
ncbi:hypothetical protein TSTA_039490 [Talaromyces stipitatus ATCC 10500]|uniref:Uncharacterized protein n=1 Tax=Talaromyces stipitatus (strain ATCC 10500 / CBS 375.48 / QM 6759 / NRRL 1006) TaxID=441959 RepID=B8M407_TALSN|nr:uncharacterized protein TSTA_039490 [Talaromyces stipitatus ATCC 10500]EED20750.1 hypothetical protein TSTA_039490 [Talaromyces stipitatus ATCC 10500]